MIDIRNVSKTYKGHPVVSGISMKINKGELVALIGPSGCGKTTMLKMINGLVKQSEGDILLDNENTKKVDLINMRRHMGYVIQQTGLFPHMTIKDNIEIVARLSKLDDKLITQKTIELMELIGLDPEIYLWRYPSQLSGGQQQRIGVARAFAMDPEIILMDEPFSALDPVSRDQLQDELLKLQEKLNKTIVFVTHDMDEAIKLADRICIMNEGKMVQFDSPENILKNPADSFVEDFVGRGRIWSSPELIRASDIMLTTPVTVSANVTLLKALEIMRAKKVDSLLIVDENKHIVGKVRPRHIRAVEDLSVSIETVMVAVSHTASPGDNLVEVLEKFNSADQPSLPIIDGDGILVGLITKSTLVTALSSQFVDISDNG